MKNRLLTFAGALALLAVLGKFYAPPLMAQVRAALMQDVDQPARAPFQITVPLSSQSGGTNISGVQIPAGKRLVVDYVTMSGAAASLSGPIQPIVILTSTVAGGPPVLYYFSPSVSTLVAGQFYAAQNTTIFADTLTVGQGFSGYAPSYLLQNVVVSGHLISVP